MEKIGQRWPEGVLSGSPIKSVPSLYRCNTNLERTFFSGFQVYKVFFMPFNSHNSPRRSL